MWAALALPLIGAEPEVRSVHEALERSETGAALDLLPRETDIEARNGQGDTLLCAALLGSGSPEGHRIVRAILDRGANPNAECSNMNLPLNQAIAAGSYAAIDLLLDRGADVNGRHSGDGSLKPVAYAYMMGHLEIAEYLQERGGTVAESVRVEALKAQAQMRYYLNEGKSLPEGLTPLEHTHFMWEVRLQALAAGIEHETNPHQARLERLWIDKAMKMRYDPDSGMHPADWMEQAMDASFEEAYQELKASGTWREDELPDNRFFPNR